MVRTRDYRFVDEMKSRYPLHQYDRAAKDHERPEGD